MVVNFGDDDRHKMEFKKGKLASSYSLSFSQESSHSSYNSCSYLSPWSLQLQHPVLLSTTATVVDFEDSD